MRTALITGGTKGIGPASARHLTDAGWRVVARTPALDFVTGVAIPVDGGYAAQG